MAKCKNCQTERLEWRQDNGRWWLFDPSTDRSHTKFDCDDANAHRRAQELADTVSRPVINKGDRVTLRGFTGTVEALTKPCAEHRIDYRWERGTRRSDGTYRTVIAGVKGDVFALIKWDDPTAYARFRKWINTRSLSIAG